MRLGSGECSELSNNQQVVKKLTEHVCIETTKRSKKHEELCVILADSCKRWSTCKNLSVECSTCKNLQDGRLTCKFPAIRYGSAQLSLVNSI